MMDLMYFGYEWEDDSKEHEGVFKQEVAKVFPGVKLIDAFDYIKGYRQEVHLDDEHKDAYLAWVIGDGWFSMSLTIQMLRMDDTEKSEFDRIMALAKKNYPKAFKPDVSAS